VLWANAQREQPRSLPPPKRGKQTSADAGRLGSAHTLGKRRMRVERFMLLMSDGEHTVPPRRFKPRQGPQLAARPCTCPVYAMMREAMPVDESGPEAHTESDRRPRAGLRTLQAWPRSAGGPLILLRRIPQRILAACWGMTAWSGADQKFSIPPLLELSRGRPAALVFCKRAHNGDDRVAEGAIGHW